MECQCSPAILVRAVRVQESFLVVQLYSLVCGTFILFRVQESIIVVQLYLLRFRGMFPWYNCAC